MASKGTDSAVTVDNPTSNNNGDHNPEPTVGTLESGKSWVTSATEGEMAPETWYYTWRAMRDRFYPHYVFYPQDPRFWDDDGVYWDYTWPMDPGISYSSLTRIPMTSRPKPDMESSFSSQGRRQIIYRKYCTCFLVLMGILLLLTATIPVLLHVFLGKDADSTKPEAIVHATLEIDNLKFSPDLTNTSHPRFRDVEQTLRKEIDELFSRSAVKRYYKGSEIAKMRNASSDTKVFLSLLFTPIDRTIPLHRQLSDILRSVPRDANDSSLGVLGKYKFKIQSLNMIDTELIYPKKTDTKDIDKVTDLNDFNKENPAISNETVIKQTTEAVAHVSKSNNFDVAKHLIRINIEPDKKDTRIQRPISHFEKRPNEILSLERLKEAANDSLSTLSPIGVAIATSFNETELPIGQQNEFQDIRQITDLGDIVPPEKTTPMPPSKSPRPITFPLNDRGPSDTDKKKGTTQTNFAITHPDSATQDAPTSTIEHTTELSTLEIITTIPEAIKELENINTDPFRSLASLEQDYPKHLLRDAYATATTEEDDTKSVIDVAKEKTTEKVTFATTDQYSIDHTVNDVTTETYPYVADAQYLQDWYDLYDTTDNLASDTITTYTPTVAYTDFDIAATTSATTTMTPITTTTTTVTTTPQTTTTTPVTTTTTPVTTTTTPNTMTTTLVSTTTTPITTTTTPVSSTTTTVPTTTTPVTTTTSPVTTKTTPVSTTTTTVTTTTTPVTTTTPPMTTTTTPFTTTTTPVTSTTTPLTTTTTHVTTTTTPVTTTTAPVTTTTTPLTTTTTPLTSTTTPLTTTTTPVPTTTTPVTTTTTSVATVKTTTMPISMTTTPVTKTMTPVITTPDTTTPVPTTTAPIQMTTTHVTTTTTPMTSTTTPLTTRMTPVTTTTTPVTTTTAPVTTTTTPLTTTTTPLTSTTTPLTTTTTPVPTTTTPVTTTTTSVATVKTTTVPISMTTTPVAKTMTPVITKTSPLITTTTPVTTTTTPVSTTTSPAITTTPVTTITTPVTTTVMLVTMTTTPVNTTTPPVTPTTTLETTTKSPVTTTTTPITTTATPVTTTTTPVTTIMTPVTTTTTSITTTTTPVTTTATQDTSTPPPLTTTTTPEQMTTTPVTATTTSVTTTKTPKTMTTSQVTTTTTNTTTTTPVTTTTTPVTTITTPVTTTSTTLTTTSTPVTTTTTPYTTTTTPGTTMTMPVPSTTRPVSTTSTRATTTQYKPDIKYLWNVGFNLLSGLDQPDQKWENENAGNKIRSISSGQARSNSIFTVFDKSDILEPKETLVISNDNSPVAFSNLPSSENDFTSETDRRLESSNPIRKSTFERNTPTTFAFPEQLHSTAADTKIRDSNSIRHDGTRVSRTENKLMSNVARSMQNKTSGASIKRSFDISNQLNSLSADRLSATNGLDWLTGTSFENKDRQTKSFTASHLASLSSHMPQATTKHDVRLALDPPIVIGDSGMKGSREGTSRPSGQTHTVQVIRLSNINEISAPFRITKRPSQIDETSASFRITKRPSNINEISTPIGITKRPSNINEISAPFRMTKRPSNIIEISAPFRMSKRPSNINEISAPFRNTIRPSNINEIPVPFRNTIRPSNINEISAPFRITKKPSNINEISAPIQITKRPSNINEISAPFRNTIRPSNINEIPVPFRNTIRPSNINEISAPFRITKRPSDINEISAPVRMNKRPSNIDEISAPFQITKKTKGMPDVIVPMTKVSAVNSTVGWSGERMAGDDLLSVAQDKPEIAFTMNGSTVVGSSVLMSWRLIGIRGWSNIVLERILTADTQEKLLAVTPNIKDQSYIVPRLRVSTKSYLSAYKGTIDVEISDLRCEDEGAYLITVMSNGTQLTSRRDRLSVSGAPGARVVVPDAIFEGQPISGVKCIASLGYPPGQLIMRVKFPGSVSFLNTFIEHPASWNDSQQSSISRTCGPVVEETFEDVLDINRDLNNTLVQCGVTRTPAIKSRTGLSMSTFKYIRIIPESLCSSVESSLILHPFNNCSYIDCSSMTVKKCVQGMCFDPETKTCLGKQF